MNEFNPESDESKLIKYLNTHLTPLVADIKNINSNLTTLTSVIKESKNVADQALELAIESNANINKTMETLGSIKTNVSNNELKLNTL